MDIFGDFSLFPALAQLLIANFSSEPWMPWVFVGCYALIAYCFMPDLRERSSRKIIFWQFVLPLMFSGAIIKGLLDMGAPNTPVLFALGIALMGVFLMGNMIAFIAHAVPVVVTDGNIRHAAMTKPFSFILLLLILFCVVCQILTLITS
ncbi:hypothetical protein NKH81_22615 [Mesorhizobium sp. M0959]|uniref:hypothetical protein n=1 Tax=Mesorhizobium sp. M0959 TaxID=2957034 RepID=UPI003337F788